MRLKKQIVLVLALILTMTLTACGGGGSKPPASSGNNTPSGNTSTPTPANVFEYGLEYIEKNLKDNYRIVYDITTYENGDTNSVTMEQIWAKEGFYFAQDGNGMLLIKNGDNYDMYADAGNGKYEKIPISYPKDAAEAMVIGITAYMNSYAVYGSMLKKDGSETVAGRDCEKYIMEYTYPVHNYKYKYTYSIDKATGVCLKFKMDLQGEGKKIGHEFIATEFQTSGVSLPKYN